MTLDDSRTPTELNRPDPDVEKQFPIGSRDNPRELFTLTDDPIEDRVTTEHSENLAFGSYDIRLSPMLGLGGLLHWSDFLQTEQIQITETRLHEQDDFIDTLRHYIDASPTLSAGKR